MPTAGIYIILNSGTYLSLIDPQQKISILFISFVCTFGLPAIFMPFFYYRNIISSVQMSEARERSVPLLVTGTIYYLTYFMFRQKGLPLVMQSFFMGSTISVFANLLINLKWKISSHAIGTGGIIGLIFALASMYQADIIFFLVVSIFVSGLICFARLSLNEHTPAQVYAGLATGMLLTMLVMHLY